MRKLSALLRTLSHPVLALLLCVVGGSAFGAASINSVTINGGASDTVTTGAALAINVNLTLNGSTAWRSTRLATSPASSLSTCIDLPSYTTGGTYNQTYNVTAPATTGTYNLVVTTYTGTGCTTQNATTTIASAIVTDNSAPRVLSIVRTSPNPTNASSVTWTVTFDRQVTGVTLNDFAFDAVGVTGLSLSGTYNTGDTSVYNMATTNTGSGTLGLNIIDNDSITGPNGVPLGGVGVNNGDYIGQVYNIDRSGPTYPTASISSNYAYSTSYARTGDIVRIVFTVTDPNTAGTPTATINGVAATITSVAGNWVATRTMTASDPEGVVTFALNSRDSFNNLGTRTTSTDGTSVTIDRTAPVATITCASPCGTANPVTPGQVTWNVTFPESVTGLSAANFTFSGSGAGGASIASVSGGPSGYTVVANVSSIGVVGLNLSQNLATLRDLAGNAALATTAVAANSYTIGGCSVAAGGGCTFDAVQTGGAINSPIYTRRIGAAITLDILALNGAVLNTSSNDSVVAQLVVATNTAACGTVVVSNAQTVTFAPANGGRRSVTFTPTSAARDVRVRLVSSGITACSRDNFAIRPDGFVLTTSNATADAAGASVSNAPVWKAGSGQFNLTAASAAGYDGTPLINQARRQAASGAAGVISGVFGAAAAGSGTASTNTFTYSEVGYFRIASWGVYDDGSFAAVDRTKSPAECRDDAALGAASGTPGDPNVANAAGQIGCYFGTTTDSAYFGRFIPDHFALSAGNILNRSASATCAASTFTYMGEQFTPRFVLTAQSASNTTTLNYNNGSFARLDVPTQLGIGVIDDQAVRRPLAICSATPVAPCVTAGAATGQFTNGVSDVISAPLTITRGTTALAPFSALKVGVAPIDPDGVALASYNLDTVNVVAGANQHALVGSTIARYGRMQIDNAYGSELLNLSVKVAAQYWTGTAYATNTLDSCTALGAANFGVSGQSGGITASNMSNSNLVGGAAMAAGSGKVVLTKPLPAPTTKGRALLQSGSSYLPGSARVTFGVYKAGPVIYLRETY